MKKKGIKFYLFIYLKIISQDIKSKLSYRADFVISTLGIIFTNIAGFITFWIMFQNFDNINGWGYYEILFLYGFSLTALAPNQCLFDNNWNLKDYVFSGDFIKYCFRPINLYFYYISEIFDLKGIGEFIMGIGILVYAWVHLEYPITILGIFVLIVMWFAASLIMAGIMNMAAATCFWINTSGYIMVTMFKFADFTKYPMDIFSRGFRIFFSFIIPIAFVSYYPSMVVLRTENIPFLTMIAPVFSAVFFYISYKIWMLGASKYNGMGS